MKRCVIVGGADISIYDLINRELREDDFIVFCDSGLKHMGNLKLKPSLIVGDFDSFTDPKLDVETIALPCEKDDTDTMFAVKEALKRGYTDFLLIGVIGARLDHTLVNVYILEYLNKLGARGRIIDDYSEMELIGEGKACVSDSYSFFSLLSIEGDAHGVCIENAKYNLENADIYCGFQYATSNEVLTGKCAAVSVKEGKLLLIKVR